jgi:hypothetical protein
VRAWLALLLLVGCERAPAGKPPPRDQVTIVIKLRETIELARLQRESAELIHQIDMMTRELERLQPRP